MHDEQHPVPSGWIATARVEENGSRGDLKFNTDFHHIQDSLTPAWLGADAKCVLHDEFTKLPLFES